MGLIRLSYIILKPGLCQPQQEIKPQRIHRIFRHHTRIVDPPPIENTIQEEDKQIFLKILRNKEMMILLQEVPTLENTAPSNQDGGGDDT